MTVVEQLSLFAEAEANGNEAGLTTRAKGPKGLLKALLEQGLPEDALPTAAALILEMDAEAARAEGDA